MAGAPGAPAAETPYTLGDDAPGAVGDGAPNALWDEAPAGLADGAPDALVDDAPDAPLADFPAPAADVPAAPAAYVGNDAEQRWAAGGSGAASPAAEHGVAWHRVTQRRSYRAEHPGAHILQARRRLLTMLATLMIIALACIAAKLTPWWTLVPPAAILGVYLQLLHEASTADAEQLRARERAAQAQSARLHARQAWEVSRPQPTAEIIDISGRVTDQLYDQYADAAVRAVGD